MGRIKQTERRSTTGESVPQRPPRSGTANISVATNKEHSNGSKSFPRENLSTIYKRWVSEDLDLLRSGLFADAEIICCDASPRKVHRNILAARSDWFKKAFSGGYTEEKDGKVVLQKSAFEVDLMLYFFYSGNIDLGDKVLTAGHDVMAISIQLLRLGDTFESKSMQDYGKDLLASSLGFLLDYICDTSATDEVKRIRFKTRTAFPGQLCAAVRSAYDTKAPAKPAQGILADFTFAARFHLFKNMEFEPFITSNQVPEFGNLVLAAQMNGGVSGAFQDNSTFKKWKDWEITPSNASST